MYAERGLGTGTPVLYHGSRLGAHGLWALDPATAPERRDVRLVRRAASGKPEWLKRVRSGSYTLLKPVALTLVSVEAGIGFGIGAERLYGGVADEEGPEALYVFDDRQAGVRGVVRARQHRSNAVGGSAATVVFGEMRTASDVLRSVLVEWYPVAGPVLVVSGADPAEHPSAGGVQLWTELSYPGVSPMVRIQVMRVARAVADHYLAQAAVR